MILVSPITRKSTHAKGMCDYFECGDDNAKINKIAAMTIITDSVVDTVKLLITGHPC